MSNNLKEITGFKLANQSTGDVLLDVDYGKLEISYEERKSRRRDKESEAFAKLLYEEEC